MKPRGNPRKRRRKSKDRNLLMLGILALIVGTIGVVQVSRYPFSRDSATGTAQPDGSRLEAFRQQVSATRKSIEDKITDKTLSLEDLGSLEITIGKLRKLIAGEPEGLAAADRKQLEELALLYEQEMGIFLYAQSLRFEEEAERLLAAGKLQEACETQEKAGNLQRRINEQFPGSSKRDHGRFHILTNRLVRWKTNPIAEEANRLKDEAVALRKSHAYEKARMRMEQALEKQRLLNEQYRSSPHASLSRLKEFEKTGLMIQAAEDIDLLSELMRQTREYLDAGNPSQALAAIKRASEVQETLDKTYRGLKGAEASRHEEISILRDTAASVEAFAVVEGWEATCRSLLLEKKPDAFLNAVSSWLRSADQFMEAYPDSVLAEKINMDKLRFLHRKRDIVSSVLDTIYSNLIPLPGEKGVAMYRTEVPQYLYQMVMERNPSYHEDPLLPVESVTWTEAHRFTELLAWILARPVHLPSENQFRKAVGDTDRQFTEEEVWSSQSSGRTTQPVGTSKVNSNGYNDLLGNVAEWLASPEERSPLEAVLAGGSARDGFESLASVPLEIERITQRNRFSGFRFVVDANDQAP